MGDNNVCSTVNIEIPFQSKRLAEIAQNVLSVDPEPPRSNVKVLVTSSENILTANFTGETLKGIRLSVNNFFENIALILETTELIGDPVSEIYSHYA